MNLKITPCLWFDHEAEEAAQLYTSIFPNSRITNTSHYSEAGQEIHQRPVGSVMTVEFELDGQPFTALNGGPMFKLTEAVSFQIDCATQAEVDHYWEKLSAGGPPEAQQCGWLKDRFGLSWQVVPSVLPELLASEDGEQRDRVLKEMLQEHKLDIDALQKAAEPTK